MSAIEELKKEYKDKRVLVVGLGLQGGGSGVARFFAEIGAEVTVTDLKTEHQLAASIDKLKSYNIHYSLGGHKEADFLHADFILKGPSVPWIMPELLHAQAQGIPVLMETAFFAAHTKSKVIGITGTRGKSTTSGMVFELLKKQNKKVCLAGNVPESPAITLLMEDDAEYTVLELSSWQLSGFHKTKVSPAIAVFTNLYPDHLNYYSNMSEYLHDKKAIYEYQTQNDYLLINSELVQKYIPAIDTEAKSHIVTYSADSYPGSLSIRGEHNRENAAAALAVAKVIGINEQAAIETISSFGGLPYRQEVVGETRGVVFVNDTTSTTPVACIKALEAFQDAPVVLILGGFSKGLPIEDLMDTLERVYKIILLKGTFTEEIKPVLKKRYAEKVNGEYTTMRDAVYKAYESARQKEKAYVLLSPSAASFGLFRNEFHRGDEFNQTVREIIRQ